MKHSYLFLSLTITAGVFLYLSRTVSVTEVVALLRSVDGTFIALFVVLSLSMSFFRTWRYHILLAVSGYRPPSIALFLVVLVRNFFADLLPARIGTLIYVYLANSRLGIPYGAALSSFALAFLFDILAIVPLVLGIVFVGHQGIAMSSTAIAGVGAALGVVVVLLILCLPVLADLGSSIVQKSPWHRSKFAMKLIETLESMRSELLRCREAGIAGRILLLSIAIRVTKYGALFVFLIALLRPLGYGPGEVQAGGALVAILLAEVAASLPVSGIAGFGAYEGVWATVFQLQGFPEKVASLTAISHHLFTQVYGYGIGVLALLLLILPTFRISSRSIDDGHRTPEAALLFAIRMVLACALIAGSVYSVYHLAF